MCNRLLAYDSNWKRIITQSAANSSQPHLFSDNAKPEQGEAVKDGKERRPYRGVGPAGEALSKVALSRAAIDAKILLTITNKGFRNDGVATHAPSLISGESQ